MARRTITIEKFTLPTGATNAPVTVNFTLVDATTHKPVDGYREDDNEGVVGLLKVKLSDASTTADLTPNEEIAGDTVWKTQVIYKGTAHRTAYIALATGGALTFPEFLTLDTSPGHWTPLWSDLISARGDLIAGTGAGTVNNLAVGTDGQALIADSGESAGLKWDTFAGDATSLQGSAVDISVGSPSDGDIMVYRDSGADFVLEAKPAGGANPAINDISDIEISATVDNDVLAYNTATGDWINQSAAEAGLATASHNHSGVYEPAGVSAADITDSTADGRALITSADANPFTDANLTTLGTATQPGDVLTRTNTDVFAPTGDYNPATKKYVDDEITGAGGYNDEAAQDAVGGILTDTAEINFTYDDATPQITASIVASSIDESKLDVSVNASLDSADSALQSVAAADITDATVDGIALITSADANPFTDANATTLGSATQPGDLATVATTGAYSDVSGTPTIPTASDATPENLGTAAAGASADFSRADHIHNAPTGSAADIDQYDVAARLSAGTGAYAGVDPVTLTEEATPATGDFLLGWESGGALRKFDVGDLPSGGGSVDTSGTPVANDFARFTDADTIEGRSYAEVKSDLSLDNVENTAISTWAGTASITTVGTVGTGTWQGTAVDGAYVDIEGTEVKSTGEGGGTKFLREDGDGTCSWQTVAGGAWDGDIADVDLDGGTDIGADLVDADLILVDDGAAGTNRKSALSRVKSYVRSGVVREIYIDAAAMVPRTTNGAASGTEEYATNDVMADHYLFDSVTEEGVQFRVAMPDAWNQGTVKVKFFWDAATGASASDGVTWGIAARAASNDDAIDSAFPSSVDTDDTVIAVGDLHVSAASSAVTVSGTPAIGDLIFVEVTRVVGDTNDDMAEDAKLLGVQIQYTESTTAPSAWS